MARLTRSDLRGQAQTVLGLIDPAQLGSTLMHEHIICDITPPKLAATGVEGDEIDICNCWQINYGQKTSALKYKLNQTDIATKEVKEMVDAGGRTIVELTCGGLKPNPKSLAEIARATGAHIVMGCGHYVHDFQDKRTLGTFKFWSPAKQINVPSVKELIKTNHSLV